MLRLQLPLAPASLPYICKIRVSVAIGTQSGIHLHEKGSYGQNMGVLKKSQKSDNGKGVKILKVHFHNSFLSIFIISSRHARISPKKRSVLLAILKCAFCCVLSLRSLCTRFEWTNVALALNRSDASSWELHVVVSLE